MVVNAALVTGFVGDRHGHSKLAVGQAAEVLPRHGDGVAVHGDVCGVNGDAATLGVGDHDAVDRAVGFYAAGEGDAVFFGVVDQAIGVVKRNAVVRAIAFARRGGVTQRVGSSFV